jgi:hypothetical protein
MTRRWPVYAVLVACALLILAGGLQMANGEDRHGLGSYSRVVVVGVPALDWRDVTPATAPRLYGLAKASDVGLLTARGASSTACPRDGWVTLGAGNRAVYRTTDSCPDQLQPPPMSDSAQVLAANDDYAFGAVPGLLAHQVDCVRTYGAEAELATIGGDDVRSTRVGLPRTPKQWRASWADCPLALVAGRSLRGDTREVTLRHVDRLVGSVAKAVARDDDTLLLVVGVSDLMARPTLHVAMASPGVDGKGTPPETGVLSSPSTGRAPYVQLIDVAPTALAALGIDIPSEMSGRPFEVTPTGNDVSDTTAQLVDEARAASVRYTAGAWLVWPWVVLTALYLLVGGWLAASDRRQLWQRPLTVAGVGVASIPAASGLANLIPWWESEYHRLAWGLMIAGWVLVLSAVALAGPWRRRRYGPAVVVAAASFGVFAVDVVTGSHLQLNGLLGYSPIVASRFTGFGNMPFAVYAAGGLVCLAAAMHGRDPRTARWLAVAGGATLVLLDGTPGIGSDFGGVLALVPAVVLLAMVATGVRVSAPRVIAALAAGVMVVTALAVADYLRPTADQTHLGRFVGQVLDGNAVEVVTRKAEANLNALLYSPVVLVPALLLALYWLFRGSESPGRRLLASASSGRSLRAALVGVGVMAVVGSLLNDSGIAVLAAAGASTVPLLIAVAASLPAPQPTPPTPVADPQLAAPARRHRSAGTAPRGDPPVT